MPTGSRLVQSRDSVQYPHNIVPPLARCNIILQSTVLILVNLNSYAADDQVTMSSVACDGPYLYLQASQGLFKVGTGFGGTASGQIYANKRRTPDNEGEFLFINVSLFLRNSSRTIVCLICETFYRINCILSSAKEPKFIFPLWTALPFN